MKIESRISFDLPQLWSNIERYYCYRCQSLEVECEMCWAALEILSLDPVCCMYVMCGANLCSEPENQLHTNIHLFGHVCKQQLFSRAPPNNKWIITVIMKKSRNCGNCNSINKNS